jgi:hypothetical protein
VPGSTWGGRVHDEDDAESFGELGSTQGLQFAAGDGNTALALDLGDIRASVVFASSPAEAERVAARHVELVERVGDIDADDLVVRRGNGVVLWSRAPEDGSARLLDECLAEGTA